MSRLGRLKELCPAPGVEGKGGVKVKDRYNSFPAALFFRQIAEKGGEGENVLSRVEIVLFERVYFLSSSNPHLSGYHLIHEIHHLVFYFQNITKTSKHLGKLNSA